MFISAQYCLATPEIVLSRAIYSTDERIIILAKEINENMTVSIESETRVFRYSGQESENLEFYAREEGKYQVILSENAHGTILSQKEFTAVKNYFVEDREIISTDKTSYLLGETVLMNVNAAGRANPNSKVNLVIESQDESLRYMDSPEGQLRFTPKNTGEYVVKIIVDFEPLAQANFTVLKPGMAQPENTVRVDSQIAGQPLDRRAPFNFKIKDKAGNFRDIQTELISESEGKYDIELKHLEHSIGRVILKNVSAPQNAFLHIGLDEINVKPNDFNKGLRNNRVIKSFYIDPSSINFTSGEILMHASGTELWKCKDWNSQSQVCLGTWNKIMDITPGQDYSILIDPNDPAFAETGISSINTLKPIYKPNEDVEILIVVLDQAGKLVSNAQVSMILTSPQGQNYTTSTMHQDTADISRIYQREVGVYKVTFSKALTEGTYNIFVHSQAYNTNSTMQTTFEVSGEYAFDILRNTPVTIDPWQGPFESTISIIPFIETNNYEFTESLPDSFLVTESGGAQKKILQGRTFLTWRNLSGNQTVTYRAQAPLVTPALHFLGNSFINYANEQNSTITFYEARTWQLAIDPISSYLYPNADGAYTNWAIQGTSPAATRWDSVNDPEDSPDDSSTYLQSPNSNLRNSFAFEDLGVSQATIQWVAVSVRAMKNSGGASATLQLFYREDATDFNNAATQALGDAWTTYSLAGWNYTTNPATGTAWNLSAINNMEWGVLRSAAAGGRLAWTSQIYVQVGYSLFPTITSLNYPANDADIGFTNNITFNFTATDDETPIANCSLWTNITGTFARTSTIFNVANNTNVNITLTNLNDGQYIWNIQCTDVYNASSFYTSNRTLNVSYTKPPRKTIINIDSDYAAPWSTAVKNPYINISLDKPASCRISQQNKSYAEMASDINCTGTGTIIANCTYTGSPLSSGVHDLYVACNSTIGSADNRTTNLFTQVTILCSAHSDCLSSQYCDSSQTCANDVLPGFNCDGISYTGLGRHEVCGDGSSRLCVNDSTYSFTGWYCTGTATDCVFNDNGNSYSQGFELCELTTNDYRTCGASNSWGSLMDCPDQFDPANQTAVTHSAQYCGYYAQAQACVNSSTGGCSGDSTYCGPHYYNITAQSCGSTLPYCDVGCGASCDISNSTTAVISGGTCLYDKSCSNACSWSQSTETAPSFCINDNDGGTCLYSSRTNATIADTCYWGPTCTNSVGAGLQFGTEANLRADYCDYCNATGNQSGQHSPQPNASCTSNCANTGTIYYDPQGTLDNRADDCNNGVTALLTDFLSMGDLWNGTAPAYCDNTECDLDCGILVGTCISGSCTCQDLDKPTIILRSPSDGAWLNSATTLFRYNVTDISSGIQNCSLIVNNTLIQTNTTILESLEEQVFRQNLANGTYYWNLTCYDDSSNNNMNSTQSRYLGIDTILPLISNPQINGTKFGVSKDICLNITASDAISGLSSVIAQVQIPSGEYENITLSDSQTTSCDASNSDGTYSAEYNLAYGGTYNWTHAFATDQAQNTLTTNPLLTWNVSIGGVLSTTLINPAANIRINESSPSNYYLQECSVECTTEGTDCIGTTIYPEYEISSGFEPVNTTTVDLVSDIDPHSCSNLTIGQTCNQTFTITAGVERGNNTWNIRCTAFGENSARTSSDALSLSINDKPVPSIVQPSNNTWITGSYNINASSSIDSDGSVAWYYFEYDNNTAFSSPTQICSTSQSNCTWNTLAQDQCSNNTLSCYLRLTTTDNDGLTNAIIFTVGFDTQVPTTTIGVPRDYDNITTNLTTVNATSFDLQVSINTVSFNYRISPSDTWVSICNVTSAPYTCVWNLTLLPDANTYQVRAYANDSLGNLEQTDINSNITLDRNAPHINLELPQNNHYTNSSQITFTYNATDLTSSIANCSLMINGIANKTSSSITEGQTLAFQQNFSQGTHNWSVTCTDFLGNTNITASRNFTIDQTGPVTIIDRARDFENITGTGLLSYNLNATVTDSGIGQINTVTFEYRINSTATWTAACQDPDGTSPFQCTWAFGSLPDASTYEIRAYSNDTLGTTGASDTNTNITLDRNGPNITIIQPANNTIDGDGNIVFTYVVNDTGTGVNSCNLTWQGAFNQTQNGGLNEGQQYSFNLTGLPNGNYSWRLTCVDSFLQATSSPVYNITVNILRIMKVNVTSDLTTYQYGNQVGDKIVLTANTTDFYNQSLPNVSITNDLIRVFNTSQPTPGWWNTSWPKRKPVFLSASSAVVNQRIVVNITGLAGNITNCSNQLRIADIYNNLIAADVLSGDNSNYCEVAFTGNISSGASGEAIYFAYYNNSASNSPNPANVAQPKYPIFFENFEGAGWTSIATNDPATQCAGGSGLFNGCLDFTSSMHFAASTAAAFRISGSRIMVWDESSPFAADRGVFHSFSATTGCGGDTCEEITVSGYVAASATDNSGEFARVWVRNQTGTAFTTVYTCADATSCEFSTNNVLPTLQSHWTFFTENLSNSLGVTLSNTMFLHIAGVGSQAADNFFFEDINITGIRKQAPNVTSTGVGASQEWIARTFNTTNSQGSAGAVFDSSNRTPGNYSVASFGQLTNFTSTYNFTRMQIITEIIPPIISLNSPASGSEANSSVTFTYTVTDSRSTVENCSLYIDGIRQDTDTVIEEGPVNFFFPRIPSGGWHNWSVNCTDFYSNTGTSGSWEIFIRPPDLFVSSTHITLSNYTPNQGMNVTINATIYNVGGSDALNAVIAFYVGDPDAGGRHIANYTVNITDINGVQSNVTLNSSYIIDNSGPFNFFVVADPPNYPLNGSLLESNETNNKANRSANAPGYHLFYGQVENSIFLGNEANQSLRYYLNLTNATGNIIAIAENRNFSFLNVRAIGMTAINIPSTNDYAEIDSAINMTNYADSIYREYTRSTGVARKTANITLFKQPILHVPIVNSSSSPNFITGIIWDASDGGFEYDGSQDIAFITQINNDKLGSHGTYDYEIKVPVPLATYNGSTVIELYWEITN
jgi:hypothetical protein